MALRLMLFDRTDTRWFLPLSRAWSIGGALYGALGRLDAWRGVASWEEGLRWIGAQDGPIAEVQFWGHGRWGRALIDRDPLDREALRGPLSPHLDAIRERLLPGGLWWFRTCETFGARPGHDFAQAFTERLGIDAAGHTHIIGAWQSGLHRLAPGARPHWSPEEGLAEGSPAHPLRARGSAPHLPHTIHCLRGVVPAGW